MFRRFEQAFIDRRNKIDIDDANDNSGDDDEVIGIIIRNPI